MGEVRGGSSASLATCQDWEDGGVENRLATIADIRGRLTPQGSETAEGDLPDRKAYEILDKTCSSESSRSLRLYKVYAHAAAFAPLRTDIERDE